MQKNADIVTAVVERLLLKKKKEKKKEENKKAKADAKVNAKTKTKGNASEEEEKQIIILDMNYGPNGGMVEPKLANNKRVMLVKCDEFCNEDRDPKSEGILTYLKAGAKIASMSSPNNPVYPDVVIIDPPYASWGGGHSLLTCNMERSWSVIDFAYSYGLGGHKLKSRQFQSFYEKELRHVLTKGLVRPDDGLILVKCQKNGRMNLPLMIRNLARSICINKIELDEVGQKSFPTFGLANDADFAFVDIDPDIKSSIMLIFRTRLVKTERTESILHEGVEYVEAFGDLSKNYEIAAAASFRKDLESYYEQRGKWMELVAKLFDLVGEKALLQNMLKQLDMEYIAKVNGDALEFRQYGPNEMSAVSNYDSTKLQICAMMAGEISIGLKNVAGLIIHVICLENNISDYMQLKKKLTEGHVEEEFCLKYLGKTKRGKCKIMRLKKNVIFLIGKINEKRKSGKVMMEVTMGYLCMKLIS